MFTFIIIDIGIDDDKDITTTGFSLGPNGYILSYNRR